MAVLFLMLRRCGSMVLTLILVSIIIFVITQALPGDVAVTLLGRYATPEKLESLRQRLGLDAPVYIQYLDWASGILHGNLGQSLVWDRNIAPILAYRLLNSLYLAGVAFFGVVVFGIGFGLIASVRPGSPLDRIVTFFSYVAVSMPEFVTGSLLIFAFAGYWLNVFPPNLSVGYVGPTENLAAWARQLVLPALTAMFVILAYTMRMTRSSMLETLQRDYVRTARLKGLSERTVIRKHALRNALIPTVTLLSINTGWLVGGLIVVESVFSYPGIGDLLVDAIHKRDLPVVQIAALTVAAVYIVANFIADLICMWLNPKLRTM